MQEFFFTILAIWVIWKLFGAFSTEKTTSYQQTNHFHYGQKQNQQERVNIETKKKQEQKIPSDEGEYVDFEEIK